MTDRPKLTHRWMMPVEEFFQRIDAAGGWPAEAQSVVMKHQCETERACYFSKARDVRDEWNTSICTADDYYLWKLSPEAKAKLRAETIREIGRSVLSMA